MIDNVTIVIPAHNRHDRLQRLLNYYRGTGIRVIVPDSSDRPFKGDLDSAYVSYLHRPKLHFLLKIKEILPLISTPYVLYCADDDFAVPEAIAQITGFLDANPSYSTAQGHYLTFTPTGNKVKFYPRYIRNFDNRIIGNTASARLPQQKGMYASMLYGVTRTEIFRDTYSYCFDEKGALRFHNLFLAEEFFNHAMLIHGNYATLPCFFSARERIPGSATETTVPLTVIKNDPAYSDEFNGFIRALGLMLSHHDNMPLAEADQLILSLSKAPIDTESITFKRKVNAILNKHRALRWAARLSEWRYHQKGFKAVRNLPSYPCKQPTPATDAIVSAILNGAQA